MEVDGNKFVFYWTFDGYIKSNTNTGWRFYFSFGDNK